MRWAIQLCQRQQRDVTEPRCLAGSGNYHADSSRVGWPDIFRTILHTHHALMNEPLYDESTGDTWPIRDLNGRSFGADGGTKLMASGGIRSEMDMLKVLIAGADSIQRELDNRIWISARFGRAAMAFVCVDNRSCFSSAVLRIGGSIFSTLRSGS